MDGTRYALLIANSAPFPGQPKKQEIPNQIVSASLERIERSITDLEDYSFGWPDNKTGALGRPHTLLNKSWWTFGSRLTDQAQQHITPDTLFLLYYFGHGVVHENQQLYVTFINRNGTLGKRTFSAIIDELHNVGVRKLIVIADLCHAGHTDRAFQIPRDGLQYYVLAASRLGYTHYDASGGQWTLALSKTLARWNRPTIVDRSLGHGTFARWFDSASREAQRDERLSPHSLDGGLANHILFKYKPRTPPPQALRRTTDRTIYNRLYSLLEMLDPKQPQNAEELRNRMAEEKQPAFLITKAGPRYLSEGAIDRYIEHAADWKLATPPSSERYYRLTELGEEALAHRGSQYNEKLRHSIYDFLQDEYKVSRDFIVETMRKMIGSYEVPNANAFLREIEYEFGIRNLDRERLEFALRMLCQAQDFRKNTGDVYFPLDLPPM